MAIEGGSGYRNNLIALAKLRANSKADPMAWTRVFVDNKGGGSDKQSKLLLRTINRMDKKGSLYTDENTDAINSYFNMLDRAYGIEEVDPNTKKKIFKPGIGTALEGLMSPVAGERKIDLSSARGLEGLRSNVPNERGGRVAGAAKREQRQGNDIIRTLGTASWSKRSEGPTPVGDIIKAAGSELKRDPQAFAQDMTLGILGSFSNIASDWAGADKNLLAEALKKRPELLALVSPLFADGNVRGRTMALEQAGVLKPDAKPLDYLDAASWFLPGVGFAKPTQVAAKVAMRAPKTVGAGVAGAGALAYTATRPDEAEAASKFAMLNPTSPVRLFGREATELERILKKVNQETRRRAPNVPGEERNISRTELQQMIDDFLSNPENQKYIENYADMENPKFAVAAHKIGAGIRHGGPAKPAYFQSDKLNQLEQAIPDDVYKSGKIKTSRDVYAWHIKNNKAYKDYTVQELVDLYGV